MKFKIYHTPGCQKCKLTDRKLKASGLDSTLIPITEELISYMRSKGMISAPLVRVTDADGTLIDEWSDMNVAKIKYYTKVQL